jgi:ParB/RepB/Spo0J family partition protein
MSKVNANPPTEEYRPVPIMDVSLSPTQPRNRDRIQGLPFEELVASIKADGVKVPVVVRSMNPEQVGRRDASVTGAPASYELIVGERRLLAAKEAGLTHVPAIIRQVGRAEAMVEQLIENLLREDLDPIEEARGYQQLLEVTDPEGKATFTQESLAKRFGKTQSHIAQRLGLLKLPDPIQDQVAAGSRAPSDTKRELSPSHARALVPFAEYPWLLEAINKATAEQGLPPAKDFPDFIFEAIFAGYGKAEQTLIRPMTEGSFFGSGRHREFNPDTKSLPRDWSQIAQTVEPWPCTKCPHVRVMGVYFDKRSDDRMKFCMLSACWDGKNRAHRKAQEQPKTEVDKEKIQDARADIERLDVAKVPASSWRLLTRGKSSKVDEWHWKQVRPIFEVNDCRTECPFKGADGGKCYRQAFTVVKGNIAPVGAVCLRPPHFEELQKAAAQTLFRLWKQGTVARLKGLAKKAAKGLENEDLVGLLLQLLGDDLDAKDEQLSRVLGYRTARVSMVEFFAQTYGLTDKGLTRQSLAKRTRKELEAWLKFALLWCKADKLSPRFRG